MTTQTTPSIIATLAQILAFDALVSAEQRATHILNEIAKLDREATNADYQLSNDALEIQKQRAREFILTLNLQASPNNARDLKISDCGIYASRLTDGTYLIAWDSWDVARVYFGQTSGIVWSINGVVQNAKTDFSGFTQNATHSLTVRF